MQPNHNIPKNNNVNVTKFIKYLSKQIRVNYIISSNDDLEITISLGPEYASEGDYNAFVTVEVKIGSKSYKHSFEFLIG